MIKTQAEIITIGDEILYGQILDTNSKWLSEELDALGVRVVQKTTIGDNEKDILESLTSASKRANLILITGGLGPTNDDLTKPCLVKYFDVSLELNTDVEKTVKNLFESRGMKFTETNRGQAFLPTNCRMIPNKMGTAPGMWFDENGVVYVSMPGVPYEMKGMMTDTILPMIRKRFKTPVIYHKIVKTIGIGESFLSDKIVTWEKGLPAHIKLAYLPSLGEVKLRLTATGDSKEQLVEDVDAQIEKLRPFAEKYFYGFNTDTLETKIGELLKARNLTVSTAESCTGGYISHLITSVAGSSFYFRGSVIAYDNVIKESVLKVSGRILEEFGAVSAETVTEMAQNVKKILGTDLGIAVSGIAGPDGGTPEKPVGTVWIAVSDAKGTQAKKLKLTKNRELNIEASAKLALNLLRQRLLEMD